MGSRRANLIPFNETNILTAENILNVAIFVPLGIYAGILFKRWILGEKLLFVFLMSLLVEGIQYFFRLGAFDVTDIITNTSGGVIGLIVFAAIEKAYGGGKAQKFVNKMAAVGTVLMIFLLALLKMNMLPIRYQ